MLISKEVEVNINNRNIKYYKNKGYKISKEKKIVVKVEDLPKGNHTKVKVQCDNPNCITPINKLWAWSDYLRQVHKDGRTYCRRCANELFGKKKELKTNISKSKSFEQWCVDNNKQDLLNLWDYKLNKIDPNNVCYSTNKKYYFKCSRRLHKSELKDIANITNKKNKEHNILCSRCNSFAQWGINTYGQDFLKKYWSSKNILNPWEIAKSSNKKVWIRCQEKKYHPDYEISCSNFYINHRCPYCSRKNKKIHPLDSLGEYIINNYSKEFLNEIWSSENKESAFKYSPHSDYIVWWKCPSDKNHRDYKRKINDSVRYKFRCPRCIEEMKESILQNKVRQYLESLYLNQIFHEYDCTIIPINPKTNHPLPFDNETILKNGKKLIVEVMGYQHYKISGWVTSKAKNNGTTPEYELHKRQLYDRYKRIYAKVKGYEYLAIPYWTDDKKETWKQLIINKINEDGDIFK